MRLKGFRFGSFGSVFERLLSRFGRECVWKAFEFSNAECIGNCLVRHF